MPKLGLFAVSTVSAGGEGTTVRVNLPKDKVADGRLFTRAEPALYSSCKQ